MKHKKKTFIRWITRGALFAGSIDVGVSTLLFQDVFTRRKETINPILGKFLGKDEKNIYAKYNSLKLKGQQWLKEKESISEYWTIQSNDNLTLSARFIPSIPESTKTIICVHGYHSTGEEEYVLMSSLFHDAGYNVLLIDQRTHGKSEGKYIGFGCLERKDLTRWIQKVDDYHKGNGHIFLHGVSMGAATVLMTSGLDLPNCVKGIVADCGYTSPMDILHAVVDSDLMHIPCSEALIQSIQLICKLKANYRFDECSSIEAVRHSKCPIFIVHGNQDVLVPVQMAKEIYEACPNKKELWIVEGANHAESSCINPEKYKHKVITFYEDCINK